jgi:IS5 family transposase
MKQPTRYVFRNGAAMKDTDLAYFRRLAKRHELAEETCRAFRRAATKRVCEGTQQEWSEALRLLRRWMDLAGKSGYADPKRKSPGANVFA